MNPYDFVRIDWSKPPERHKPIWHHRLFNQEGPKLYSGQLEVDIYLETPSFIADTARTPQDPKKPAEFYRNAHGQYAIPGSSLKGMLRSLVETLGNGCFTLYDGHYESHKVDYRQNLPASFQHCNNVNNLCIACRTFGTLQRNMIFLGKVNISDAIVNLDRVYEYEAIYTKPLMTPKPHHDSFYLDEQRQHIAGRKFFFHHPPSQEPLTAPGLSYMGGRPANRYIRPLDYDTQFHFRIDFTNLEQDEFAALLLSVTLEEEMRHKIGYAKPLGLGSIQLKPTKLTLIDYATRYSERGNNGKTILEGDDVWYTIDDHTDPFKQHTFVQDAMNDLRYIWAWPPDETISYSYPRKDWFSREGRGKRIEATRDLD
jgi:CRISPR/Cas system CSM-associated protein Csm3 (group 7 of RAMP superfamily)